MTRTLRSSVPLLLLAVLAVLGVLAVTSAPGRADRLKASSRIRDLRGRMQYEVRAAPPAAILDSLTAAAAGHGYDLVARDPARLRIQLEKPATLGEVGAMGWKFENTERKRILIELADVKRRPDRRLMVGAILLVQNPGAENELDQDMGRVEPYRAELRAILDHGRAVFGP